MHPSSLADNEYILGQLELILRCHRFIFHNTGYLQTHGAAMGSECPRFTLIFLWVNLRKALHGLTPNLRPCIFFMSTIFIVWNDTEGTLLAFLIYLNNCHHTIKFTLNYSTNTMSFLDVNVKRQENSTD